MFLKPIYDDFSTILQSYSHNLHAFYVFLAFKEKLDFSDSDEFTINSFFGRKPVNIFNIKIYNDELVRDVKYQRIINHR